MAGHMKKKRCNHVKDEWMPVPQGYNKKDFQKLAGGMEPFLQTRIKDFISYFLATNIPDNEALFVIEKQFGVKLAKSVYQKMKQEIMSNVEVQTWLNSYARIGFVSAHIQDIERTKMMTDKVVAAYLMEMSKPHDERDYRMLAGLRKDYVDLTKLAVVLRAGAPVLARIKAMIDASNIRAMENDPTLSEEEKQKILSHRGKKTATVITVPNTLTDDPTDLTVVSRNQDNKNIEKEERGKVVEYGYGGHIKRKSSQKVEKQDLENIKSGESDQSGSEFIRFLINESKSDDILPKRYRDGLNINPKE